MPVLSIITINYNNKAGLQKTIASVLSQSHKAEFIVIDGGSNDGSAEVIKQYQNSFSYSVSEADKGIYDAMNKGISKATGDYLLFLNSGDVLAGEKILEEMIPSLGTADIVYGDLITINSKGEKETHHSFEDANVYHLMISTIWHPCAFIKREAFSKCGNYNVDLKLAGDYEFFVRSILKFGASAKYVPKVISEFDLGGVSNKGENNTLMNAEREKAWELNFSEPMIRLFKESVNLYRSREYKLGKLVTKFIPGS